MGRKSLAKERTAQICDAFERCIVARGRAANSLPRVAGEAGVQLSAINHDIGDDAPLKKSGDENHGTSNY